MAYGFHNDKTKAIPKLSNVLSCSESGTIANGASGQFRFDLTNLLGITDIEQVINVPVWTIMYSKVYITGINIAKPSTNVMLNINVDNFSGSAVSKNGGASIKVLYV